MRCLLALCLTLLLCCAHAQEENCYKRDLETDMGTCGKIKMEVGMCAGSGEQADAMVALFSALGNAFGGEEMTDDQCEATYASMCGSVEKVKATGCDEYCNYMKASATSGDNGCSNDDECPETDTEDDDEDDQLPCCDYQRSLFGNLCSYTDSELDTMIAEYKSRGSCADTDCWSAGAHTAASIATSLLMGLMATWVSTRRF
mmetsp:Transcript_131083/g.195353  ORF Transcript_131083/g.195353 Transcript_131083/m.195353 type:complete len:202 (+) Transcript_131083:74-679(+)